MEHLRIITVIKVRLFVNNENNSIRTAFKREQYDDAAEAAMEVLKHGGA